MILARMAPFEKNNKFIQCGRSICDETRLTMFTTRTCVVVTGASKGIGKAIVCSLAQDFSQNQLGNEAVFVLTARSKEGLEETKNAVANISSKIKVHIIVGDLGDLPNLPQFVTSLLNIVDPDQFPSALLVNNAGNVGDVTKTISGHSDVQEIQNYMDLNITSPFYLLSQFLNMFPKAKKYVVNISSLCAVKAVPSLSLYCTGKAARDMLHQVLADESKDVRVLNYAPGPVDTDMFDEIRKNSSIDETKQMFKNMKDTGAVLRPNMTSEKLMVILKQDRYKSGAHVDYFDELP